MAGVDAGGVAVQTETGEPMTDTRAKLKELSAKWRKETDGACPTFRIDEDSIITGTVVCADCFASREDHEQATRLDELDALLAQMDAAKGGQSK